MKDLEGKVAIVTGGARGIGGATAEALCSQGASVVITDVLDEEGQALVKKLAAAGRCARYVHLDVTDESQWERVVADTVRDLGSVDILVHNAGSGTFPDVEQDTRGGWDKVIAVNQGSVWLSMKPRYAKEGIRVNSMHPGFIDTPMVAQVKGTRVEQQIVRNTPIGRLGRPEEVGEVIAFMCGPKASYMTGSEVYVDGGWTAA